MVNEISADALCRRCDPEQFGFETTADLPDLEEIIGQARAIEALQFGVAIRRDGYNLFVLGPPGVGKYTVVRQYLEQRAASDPRPADWCYVNNFEQPHKPRVLNLPSGRGQDLRRDMERLLEDLRNAIPAAFETEEYHTRLREIEESYKERREHSLSELARETEEHGIALIRTPGGFAFAPETGGEVIKPEEYEKLPEDEKKRIEKVVAMLQEKLSNVLHQAPKWQRESREKVKALDQEIGMFAVGHLIEEMKKKYEDIPAVGEYLASVEHDVIANLHEFRHQEETTNILGVSLTEKPSFRRYEVNVLVDHGTAVGAPVVYEDNPIYPNLVGRVEHLAQMGALVTDFMLIKPGALHLANGGYLILEANKVLLQPFAWEGLKRALYSREIKIQSLGQIYSFVSTVSLEPEPIALDLKVVLLGDRTLYYLLMAYDSEFAELFKVAADFEDHISRDGDNNQLYARLIATLVRREELQPLDRTAVARVIEHSSRLAEDAERLSTHMLNIVDLLREADHWARVSGRKVTGKADVQRAIDAQIRRADRLRDTVHENILRNIIMIDTEGEKLGQVNGLSVIDLGNFSFAQPTRITANARLGEGEVIDIEREVELGGAIHSKGVLILSSYLAARYSSSRPLSLSASLVFEQSYGMVEGDSASVGELCALLSILADAPIRQSLAVTGSVNQHGEIQAIGGVNEKIEGFFDICKARGLSGTQGVLIPATNTKFLMLRDDLIQAVRAGQFHIYPIRTVDDAIALLTGIEAGEADEEGNFPEGSINHRVDAHLGSLAEIRHEFARPAGERGEDEQPHE